MSVETFVFFDKPAVDKAVDAGTKRALSKFGAYVRTRAKTSIRKRKAISVPGNPPSSHTGHLKKLIYFGYDQAKRSVVVGPLPYHKGVANVIENGGIVDGKLYRARPFMKPAFDKELPNAAKLFQDQIK